MLKSSTLLAAVLLTIACLTPVMAKMRSGWLTYECESYFVPDTPSQYEVISINPSEGTVKSREDLASPEDIDKEVLTYRTSDVWTDITPYTDRFGQTKSYPIIGQAHWHSIDAGGHHINHLLGTSGGNRAEYEKWIDNAPRHHDYNCLLTSDDLR